MKANNQVLIALFAALAVLSVGAREWEWHEEVTTETELRRVQRISREGTNLLARGMFREAEERIGGGIGTATRRRLDERRRRSLRPRRADQVLCRDESRHSGGARLAPADLRSSPGGARLGQQARRGHRTAELPGRAPSADRRLRGTSSPRTFLPDRPRRSRTREGGTGGGTGQAERSGNSPRDRRRHQRRALRNPHPPLPARPPRPPRRLRPPRNPAGVERINRNMKTLLIPNTPTQQRQ